MPITKSSAGISSYNELFAMKKNLAFEAKFEHRMSSMTRDFFHKRENLKHEIRTVYGDMKNIQRSTGYSLDQVRSGRTPRKPNAPTIYLPPIGLRLVKKYVGLDFKRMSLAGDPGEQRRFSNVINNAFNLQRGPAYSLDTTERHNVGRSGRENDIAVDIERISAYERSTSSLKSASQRGEKIGSATSVQKREVSFHLPEDGGTASASKEAQVASPRLESNDKAQQETATSRKDLDASAPQTTDIGIRKEPNLDESIFRHSTSGTERFEFKREETGISISTSEGTDEAITVDGYNEPKKFSLDTTYNLTERRSSRSTFRTRSSIRVPSERSHLSDFNMEVIGLKGNDKTGGTKINKTTKPLDKIGPFYLDYGDGKLHDNMEIPKFRDCARPWCNPHCKTCQNRTTGRPCFVIVPVDDSFRRRKLPLDNRRTSMFPVLPAAKNPGQTCESDEAEAKKNGSPGKTVAKDAGVSSPRDVKSVSDADGCSPRSISGKENDEVNCESITPTKSDPNKQLSNYLQERKDFIKKEKKFNKKRLEELAQPRGGQPAEVRFSKMTLRKEQEQMIESERRKALTKYEQDNLAFIQGKISLFLALLNQQELTGKPGKMVDLPIREKLSGKRKKKKSKNTTSLVRLLKHGRGQRGVTFSPSPRYRLMS